MESVFISVDGFNLGPFQAVSTSPSAERQMVDIEIPENASDHLHRLKTDPVTLSIGSRTYQNVQFEGVHGTKLRYYVR